MGAQMTVNVAPHYAPRASTISLHDVWGERTLPSQQPLYARLYKCVSAVVRRVFFSPEICTLFRLKTAHLSGPV
jgi:hypothetical protein